MRRLEVQKTWGLRFQPAATGEQSCTWYICLVSTPVTKTSMLNWFLEPNKDK